MKFVWTTLQVKNMNESLAFYQDIIGLRLETRHSAGPETELAFMGEGDTKVELVCNGKNTAENSCKGISLGFMVDSLDNTIEWIKKNGLADVCHVIQPNSEVKFFFVKDPDGYNIQFVEQTVNGRPE